MKVSIKFIVTIASLVLSSYVFAENFECRSDDLRWEISLELGTDVSRNILIKKDGNLFLKLQSVPTNSYKTRLPGQGHLRHYEMQLGGIKYLYVVRRLINKVPINKAQAEFLPTNNPVGFAQFADCFLVQP